ncbi:hypothetical protein AFLA_005811 [Aspergillus flavus NRRL3357]|nr:hypothetical protein AFLA_005811 [Aspergillus flavus NRRL3357]
MEIRQGNYSGGYSAILAPEESMGHSVIKFSPTTILLQHDLICRLVQFHFISTYIITRYVPLTLLTSCLPYPTALHCR